MATNARTIERYGAHWPAADYDPLEVELRCIERGGHWLSKSGVACGAGLFTHYRNAQSLCWPDEDHHRWSDLILHAILEHDVTVLMGPGDSAKTYTMSRYALIDWWVAPQETLFLISSTDVRGLELRVWGKLKDLFNRAREQFPWLPGNVLESLHSITPDNAKNDNQRGRLLDRGLICIPCISGGRYVGLGKYCGIKQKRLRHIGDELQHMGQAHLSAYSNFFGKSDFKGVMAGNPLEPNDPLGRAAEPLEGWTGMIPPTKTTHWTSTFYDAHVINLVGTDSPNFDVAADEPIPFPYLINRKKLDMVSKTYGKDSLEWCSQCEGVLRPGLVGKRVITRELCRQHHAFDTAFWNGTDRTRIYACDPAYGGGDRCVGGWIEFGEGIDGKPILRVNPPEIIPISIKLNKIPEDQIAEYIQEQLSANDIPVENAFYDSFGKGTLGFAFARIFGSSTPTPIDSGAKPTKRPVRFDLFVEDQGEKRLKRCDEHYSKFISEAWLSCREVIEGEQLRELPEDVMLEGCMREYKTVLGNRLEIEPKEDTRERMGKSPDLFDWLAVAVEGARQRGFQIRRLGMTAADEDGEMWWEKEAEEFDSMIRGHLLTHA